MSGAGAEMLNDHALASPGVDAQLVALWLHGRSPRTQRVCGANVRRFLAHCGKLVATVRLLISKLLLTR